VVSRARAGSVVGTLLRQQGQGGAAPVLDNHTLSGGAMAAAACRRNRTVAPDRIKPRAGLRICGRSDSLRVLAEILGSETSYSPA